MAFNTTEGAIIERELMILCINTGTKDSPSWAAIGARVTDSSMEFDWSLESSQDILGTTRVTMKKPVVTQSFDPLALSKGDAAVEFLHKLAIEDQDYSKLAAMDVMVWHKYDNNFAERYDSSAIQINSIGGEGGGNINMPLQVTLGGERTTGTASQSGNTITFSGGSSGGGGGGGNG